MANGAETPENQKFYKWFQQELGSKSFTTREGREFLEKNLEIIMEKVDSHFTPEFMNGNPKAAYFKDAVEAVREAYADVDYSALAEAMDLLKTRCRNT